jgi:hypothetical protein
VGAPPGFDAEDERDEGGERGRKRRLGLGLGLGLGQQNEGKQDSSASEAALRGSSG